MDNTGTPGAPHVLLTYTYDAADNRTGVTDNLNGSISYTYDADHRLTNVSMTVNGTGGPQVTMTPDPYGRMSLIVRQSPGGKQVVTNYSYDADNRVTYIQQGYYYIGTVVNQLALCTYAYDNAGEETGYTGPEGSITLAYDRRGELTGVSGAWSESYSYDLNGNRTMTGYTTSTGNRLTSDGTYNYTYDNEGNLLTKTRISDGQVTNFTWDYRNRLTEVTVKTSAGTTLQDDKFTYDVANRRIGKNTLSSGQSWIAYDGDNPYSDFNSSGSLTYRYLYGSALDSLLARYDGTNTIWYLGDKLGSVRLLVDKSANIQDTITYDTFGNIRSETGTGDRFKFTAREWDSEIGLYFYRARYYAPTIGRFESEDPLGFDAGDTNLFRYVRNAPDRFSDPSGVQYQYPVPYIAIAAEVKIGNKLLDGAVVLVDAHIAQLMANDVDNVAFNDPHSPGPQYGNVKDYFAGFVTVKTGWFTWKKVPIIAKKVDGVLYILIPVKEPDGTIGRRWVKG